VTADFTYLKPGIASELGALDLGELCQHYLTHIRSFVLDEDMGSAYFNHFASNQNLGQVPAETNCFIHLVRKMRQMSPFNHPLQEVANQISPTHEGKISSMLLGKYALQPDLDDKVDALSAQGDAAQAHDLLLGELSRDTGNVIAASRLAAVDAEFGVDMTSWMQNFALHDVFARDWNTWLAGLHVQNGMPDKALELWDGAEGARHEDWEVACNFMGAASISAGQNDVARALFARSLSLDVGQYPIELAMRELDEPFVTRDVDLSAGRVAICLYSYNKADLLDMTLRSLCASDIGESDVFVLLNGCSDGSQEVVSRVRTDFPAIRMEVLDLPVNIGAPAARNTLLHHALNERGCEHIAFLDDDVTLPADWLKAMLTSLEDDPAVGAVGCRVLDPGGEDLQYLYRDVAIAKPGMFRLSLGAPFKATDIGLYNVRRDTDCVMGCCHLMRRECFDAVPDFDIRFSPTQLDDVAFHLDLRLAGYSVRYLGQVACIHHRATGFQSVNLQNHGNSMGNEVKFYYRFADQLETFRSWQAERTQSMISG